VLGAAEGAVEGDAEEDDEGEVAGEESPAAWVARPEQPANEITANSVAVIRAAIR